MTTEQNNTEKAGNLENLEEFTELTVDVNPELVSICKDSGARTEEAKAIYMKSRTMIQEIIGNKTPEDRFRQRCVIATGDLSVADIMRFMHDPIPAGVDAIKKGAPIFVDINMVKAGITKAGHKSEIICVLDEDPNAEIANRYGITRTSAGFLAARDRLDGSIIAIGNAPSHGLQTYRKRCKTSPYHRASGRFCKCSRVQRNGKKPEHSRALYKLCWDKGWNTYGSCLC
jgi:precorrin-8X/cobalt-precorrin-8 methylmutase